MRSAHRSLTVAAPICSVLPSRDRKGVVAGSAFLHQCIMEDMADECAFCRLAASPQEADIVWEDRDTLAFLDHRPLFAGHCLLIPRRHFETLPDLPPELVAPLFGAARILSAAVAEAMHAEGSLVAINNRVSQSVPHLHVHVVPRRKGDGLRGFFWPRSKYRDADEARAVAAAIREEALRSKPSGA